MADLPPLFENVMKKISIPVVKGMPTPFFVMLGLFASIGLIGMNLSVVAVPCVMAVIIFAYFRYIIGAMADEVLDCGDTLLVKRGTVECQVRISDIKRLIDKTHGKDHRIVLKLRRPCLLGSKVAFAPVPSGANFFRAHSIAKDLRSRIEESRKPGIGKR
jgi:hypothetical protein